MPFSFADTRLRCHDKVAYVRFASVYLDFKDVQEFMLELKDLLKAKDMAVPAKTKTSGAKTQLRTVPSFDQNVAVCNK